MKHTEWVSPTIIKGKTIPSNRPPLRQNLSDTPAFRSLLRKSHPKSPNRGPVLVLIEGPVELVEQGGTGDLLFHEAAEDDEAASAKPCHRGRRKRK